MLMDKDVTSSSLTPTEFEQSYSAEQEPIFPSELQLTDQFDKECLIIKGDQGITWYRPNSLDQLFKIKSQHPNAKMIIGNTRVGLEMKSAAADFGDSFPVLIHPVLIKELHTVQKADHGGIIFGGSVTLSTMQQVLTDEIQQRPESEARFYSAIVEMLRWFAGKQIRNAASIAGSIMTASPMSDLNPLFLVAGCQLTLQSQPGGVQKIKMDETFFTGNGKNTISADQVLLNIFIPTTCVDEHVAGFKQSRRRVGDVAIVNAAFRVIFHPLSSKIKEIFLAFGGMAPKTILAMKTMQKLIGRDWKDDSLVEDVCHWFSEDFPQDSASSAAHHFRQSLCMGFFFKFHLQVTRKLKAGSSITIPDEWMSAERDIPGVGEQLKSSQRYQLNSKEAPVGRPMSHVSSEKHTTGEAIYCDDLPSIVGELHMALVLSSEAHAEIISIDPSAALALEGVCGFFSAQDVPEEKNNYGLIVQDDQVFASKKVTCCGQVVACVLADTFALAQQAARLVHVTYRPLEPVIFTLEDAIRLGSAYYEHSRELVKGDVETAMKEAENVLEGSFKMAGQEHFYLETHAVRVIPKGEDGQIDITCATQITADLQKLVANLLDVPINRIVCRVRRIGGGFGGKQLSTARLFLPAAFAASRLNRPVRCSLTREEDMSTTGNRHPFLARYKVAFTSSGKLTALDVQLYNNAGNTMEISKGVMEKAMFHVDNCYRIDHFRCRGLVCRTNLPSNTAFRGFGIPQGMAVCENIINDIASHLQMDPVLLRRLNFYRQGDTTHYNQMIDEDIGNLDRCWTEVQVLSQMDKRRKEVDLFNRTNRFKKRGLALIPTKNGISFTATCLNQTGVLLHIYKDGSVMLSHGWAEMGQGIHTKMIQVASRVLNIPPELVFISETSTDKVPNTSANGASTGSDLNGMAVLV